MKRKVLLFPALLALAWNMNAQIPHIIHQIPDSVLAEDAFDQLDTSSLLTTGFLWDRIDPHFDFQLYAGHNDGPVAGTDHLKQAYIDIREMAADSLGGPGYIDYLETCRDEMFAFDAVPIVSYAVRYNAIRPSAIADSLLFYENGQFSVNPNAPSSPFLERTFWMGGLFVPDVPTGDTFHFVVPKYFHVSNLWSGSDSIVGIQVDADDGLGYRTVSWDTPFPVSTREKAMRKRPWECGSQYPGAARNTRNRLSRP